MNILFSFPLPDEKPDSKFAKSLINPSRLDPGRREKLTEMFIFLLLFGASKVFMKAFKAFKAFIKPFEAPQRSLKI